MTSNNDNDRAFTRTAIALHWATATFIISAFVIGEYVEGLPFSPIKLRYFSYHKWAGATVLLFTVFRLPWRVTHPAPLLPEKMPAWERLGAGAAHLALYALMFAVPVTGWLSSSAHGFQTVYLGLLPVPDLLAKNKDAARTLETVHSLLNKTLLAVFLAHVAAALRHHFLKGDDVLKRMLRWRRSE